MSVYGTNEGYSLNAAPLSAFPTPSQSLRGRNAMLYTPNMITLDPSWTTTNMAMAAASTAAAAAANGGITCANAQEAALMGAAKCIDPQTMRCVRIINNQCPKGYLSLVNGQVSGNVPAMSGYAPFK